LHLRARPVDLVEEKRNEAFAVAKQRSRFDAWLTVRIDICVIDQIARHQVDCAFYALEVAADGAGKCSEYGGLSDADVAFE
jgi:hypothetical protein